MDWLVKSMFYVFYASMVQDCRSIETLRAPTQLATHQHPSCPCCQKRQAPARPKLEIRRKFAISQHENPRIKLRIRQCEHFQATADPGKSTISSSISFQRETLPKNVLDIPRTTMYSTRLFQEDTLLSEFGQYGIVPQNPNEGVPFTHIEM